MSATVDRSIQPEAHPHSYSYCYALLPAATLLIGFVVYKFMSKSNTYPLQGHPEGTQPRSSTNDTRDKTAPSRPHNIAQTQATQPSQAHPPQGGLMTSPLSVSSPSSIGPAAPDIIPPPPSSASVPAPVLADATPATDNAPAHPQDAPKEQPLTDPDDIDQDDFIIIERSA
eukprot:TRINITY_DN134_c0_g1_i3.p1 TRINITY_DN134_c0_g1~~TRINITY_DN134_c0_g1_i3.p1  ORF type:complete len:179 (-),score=50.91 TRINITY_DN134_c0_g1_i3:155-667(-)